MAIQFLSGLNVDGNITLENSAQLKAARIDNLSSDPSGSLGRIYYNTSTNKLRLYNGGWVDIDTGTDGDTTYDLAVPAATTKIRLSGSNGTNDDVEIAGGSLITVTRTNSAKLTISTSATANVGTVTSVSGGDGISISGSSTVSPTVSVDYAGTDNAILVASSATPVGADTLWFSDATDNTIKKSLLSNFPGFGADGTVTSVTAGTGLVLESGSSTVNPTIGLDYAGADNFINEASNGTGVTVAATDRVVISDVTDNNVKYVTISQLTSAVGGGTVTSVNVSGGSTGLSFSGGPITTSGVITLSGTLDETNGGTGQTSYTTGDILYASGSNTLAKLAIGSAGQVLKVSSGGIVEWAADTNTGLTSVGITETGSALTITNSPLTSNGNINIAGAGTASQVILGNLTLADLPVDGVTSVATPADGGLTGGTITSTGNLRLKNYSALTGGRVMRWDNTNNQLTNAPITISNNDASLTGDLTVSGGDIILGGTGRIQGVDTVSANTDAANKLYVDQQLAGSGLLLFQGGYNASTNTPDLDSSPSSSIKKGWSYVVTADGSFFTEQVRVGDLLIAQQDAPTTLAHWVTVQSNIDLASTTTVGLASFSSADFAVSAAGAVTIKTGGVSNAQLANTYNQIIGTDSDINTSGVIVVDQLNMTDGVIQSHSTRTLPDANTSSRGVVETATQSEVNGGTDSFRYVSPLTLKGHLDAQSYSGTFPASNSATWTVGQSTHGLGSGPFVIQTFDADGCQVFIKNCKNDEGDIEFTCSSTQSANTITVVIMKVR